jgi:hypothetical protein
MSSMVAVTLERATASARSSADRPFMKAMWRSSLEYTSESRRARTTSS